MTLEQILAECREWFTDPDFGRLRALREQGRRLIGCFPVYTPEEVVMAARLVPVHLFGGGTMVEIDHADSRMQSFVCSITRSTFELGLTKRLAMLDGMLFPSICDVARNLSGLWRRNLPDHLAEFIHFPENFQSAHAVPYLRHELQRLEQRLTAISGHAPGPDDYRRTFERVNRWQAAVNELYALRAAAPWNVPLADAYALVRAGGMMPREQHLPLLEQALATWRAAGGRPQDRVRVIVEGSFCEQPSLELLQTIEESGCYVVNDDYLLGLRWHTAPLPLDGDPLEALRATSCSAACRRRSTIPARRAAAPRCSPRRAPRRPRAWCSASPSSASRRSTTSRCSSARSRRRAFRTCRSSSRRR